MKEIFNEYLMFSLDVIVGVIGILMFKQMFWGSESLLSDIIVNFMEYLM